MQIFFALYAVLAVSRWLVALFFFLLTVTTAPDDTALLLERSGAIMKWLQGNVALDLTIIFVGLVGLAVSFGWGNWRQGAQRFFGRKRLERLEEEARRVAVDIAHTLSQEAQRQQIAMDRRWAAKEKNEDYNVPWFEKDQRYLSKHMMESASIIRRLRDVGYWQADANFLEIGVTGAPSFAAEAVVKELYTSADRIRDDLKDGVIVLLTQPPAPAKTAKKTLL